MRVLKNETTERYEADPGLLRPFPEQLGVSYRDGTFHLGGDENTQGVDSSREGYPAGQVVGAIVNLQPAANIVRDMVSDATKILERLSSL